MSRPCAPIAVFIYNRPEHTTNTLKALTLCDEFAGSPIFVYCDGPKQADSPGVSEARAAAKSVLGSSATYIESNVNKGLARSITEGVSHLCKEYGAAIVIEDDLVVGQGFLSYMNNALEKYRDESKVMQVAGYMYPVPDLGTEALFMPFTSTWGWATWQRAWNQYDAQAEGWGALENNEDMRRSFNVGDAIDYSAMLKNQMSGKIDSWGILWNWSVFKASGVVLYPPYSLVTNIGFDGTGTHGWRSAKFAYQPIEIEEHSFGLPDSINVYSENMEKVMPVLGRVKQNIFMKLFLVLKDSLSVR